MLVAFQSIAVAVSESRPTCFVLLCVCISEVPLLLSKELDPRGSFNVKDTNQLVLTPSDEAIEKGCHTPMQKHLHVMVSRLKCNRNGNEEE